MKIFEASVSDGQIQADKGVIVDCPILGEGGDSTGYLIQAEGKLVYFPKTSPDLKETLEHISEALNIIATGIFPANLGGDITTSTFASDVQNIKQQIDELKGKLK